MVLGCNSANQKPTMLPSKSMMEYMTEMQRLFPRPELEDSPARYSFNADQPLFQSALANRSSSSTDSTSPESYPDLSCSANYRPLKNTRLQDTPFPTRPHRAIVGRKILGNSQQITRLPSLGERMDRDFDLMQYEDSLSVTPPENRNNCFYELFPSERKTFDFKTPIKSEPGMFEISPTIPERSPVSNNSPMHRSLSNLSPMSNRTYRPQRLSNQFVPVSVLSPTWSNTSVGSTIPAQAHHGFRSDSSSPCYIPKYPNLGACSSVDEIASTKMCTFCRKNGETPIVYMTHSVKEQMGNKNVVTCPILRSHKCATCGASGDNAHTITYCPVLRSCNNGKPLQSTTITLKNTRIKSNGRRRY